ncbi:MAG: hypothetical protein HQL40_06400 [Alphaproteobacteria bacterium]|nr:hypothetical protein [Alphaproteobacteria bacterium]
MNTCLFVVADKNMEFALRGLLERDGWDRSIGCRRFGGWHIVTASG